MQIVYDVLNYLTKGKKPKKKISYLFIVFSPFLVFIFVFVLLIIRLFNIKIKRGDK